MFKHILFPTDGSAASDAAIPACLQFAKEIGASVTCVHVLPTFHIDIVAPEMMVYSHDRFTIDSELHANKLLVPIVEAAKAIDVPCDSLSMTSDHPYEAIIQAALERECDLITMASHGHRGIKAFLLGSETQKVLSHSKIPVLVFR